jgi:hypothetical protein
MQNYWLGEMVKDTNYTMAPAEQEFVDSLRLIAKKYGKLSNSDGNGIWVGYVEASDNENADIGVMCKNCAQYEGNGVCKIVKQKVQSGGYCRLAAIPDGVVKKDDDDDQGDDEED